MFCYISYTNGVAANFVLKFPNFRYHGNKGRSFVNFNVALKLHAHENPLFHARFLSMIALNYPYHGNEGHYLENLNVGIKLCDLEKTLLGTTFFAICLISTEL